MDQLESWVSSLTAVIFGLLTWVTNYWSLSTVLLIVPGLVIIAIVVELFLLPPRSM